MRAMHTLVAFGILAHGNVGLAQGFHLAGQVGYTRLLNGDGVNGFGVDLYPGYDTGFRYILELQLGFHHHRVAFQPDGGTTTITIPVMAGVRFKLDLGLPIVPFAGAHAGATYATTTGLGERNGSNTDFSFNVGLGAEYALADFLGVGVGVWYWMILSGSRVELSGLTVETEHGKLLSAGIVVTLAL